MAGVEPNLAQPEGAQLPPDKNNAVPTSPVAQTVAWESLLPATQEEERISIASNWTLVWWHFRTRSAKRLTRIKHAKVWSNYAGIDKPL